MGGVVLKRLSYIALPLAFLAITGTTWWAALEAMSSSFLPELITV